MEASSHATELHDAAQQKYAAAMEGEDSRFQQALNDLQTDHAERVRQIADEYTTALGEADAAASA